MAKMQVSFQNLLWLTASTIWPKARSLSAAIAAGVGQPALRAAGVVVRQADDAEVREIPGLLELLQLLDELRGPEHVGNLQRPAHRIGGEVGPQRFDGRAGSEISIAPAWLTKSR